MSFNPYNNCYNNNYNNCSTPVQYYVPVVPGCVGPTGVRGPTGPTDKTFVIQHPDKPDRYLVHACVEGPEAGVYYRGKSEIEVDSDSVTIILPNYVVKLAREFTIQITPIFSGKKRKQLTYETTEIRNGCFTVYGEPGKFFWHVYGKRADIEVEPLKSEVEVKGSGPYRWL